jgi:ABC-2 type transport system permease protein
VSVPGSAAWFAAAELRLAWRDFVWLLTAGERWRRRNVLIGFAVFVAVMHLIAYGLVGGYADAARHPDKTTLVVVTGSALLSWSVMLAQAMETVTRGLYARADLDLILSSPASARTCFAVRIAAMPASIALMTAAFAAPFIDVLALRGGWGWLGGYSVVLGMALLAVAIAVLLTMLLFRTLGPGRTRLASQIVAAVIGAAFVIFLQVAAILSYGTLSRTAFLQSPLLVALAPDARSPVWIPARAILGEPAALAIVLLAGLAAFAVAILVFAGRFGGYAAAAAGHGAPATRQAGRDGGFRVASPSQVLRRKEWVLLARDPWLMSQSLMQLLYLAPPALLLWRSFGSSSDAVLLLVPVLVMAAGQLAGGLAWLAVSGEDAPDLIATAPVSATAVLRAKIEAVLGSIAIVIGPFLAILAIGAPFAAAVGAVFAAAAGASATAVQLWFRAQAKRSYFRRRQTSSRIATFAEALSSVGWAAAGGFAAHRSWLALVPAGVTLLILMIVRSLSPAKTELRR